MEISSDIYPKIVAVIPAYNEEQHVREVVISAIRHIPVLVVDDGSIDQTAQIAERSGATVWRQIENQGKGAALRAGFRWALVQGYEGVITLDSDGQHDPEEIPSFVDTFHNGHKDLIIGVRQFEKMPPARRLGNHLGRILFSWAIGHQVPDNQSGYRLVSSRLMAACLESEESGFEFEVEMIVTCLRNGMKLDSVPIKTIYADEKSHIHPGSHIRNFIRVILAARKKMTRKTFHG